ncbi:hypothetical protein [Shewanella sp. SR44-3]|uniref:hypothetical protein n=1 Tax=Shewanella sp. SR44-3 TaxID=2760936 RepID=UPI0015FD8853|nr:hypothetical protein [Shewanella sp. SR44-3]MBB1268948.1 hypothetical protein [Shewanella sp. SR44-3]
MDLEILEFVIQNEHRHLAEAVAQSRSNLDAAIGVAKFLLGHGGDISQLKGGQIYVYEHCIKPIFSVPCEGVFGEDTCTGNGFVDEESLMGCYIEDDFQCQFCQHDASRMTRD